MLNIGITTHKDIIRNIQIADPFSGTGTTLFESIKYSDCKVSTSDLDPLTTILINDNARFFSMNRVQLIALKNMLMDAPESDVSLAHLVGLYDKCANLFENIRGGEIIASGDDLRKLQSLTFNDRFLFYFLLRTQINAIASIVSERVEFLAAYKIEVSKFVKTLTRYIKLLDRVKRGGLRGGRTDKFLRYVDKYSTAVMVNPSAIAEAATRLEQPKFKHEIRGVKDLPQDHYHLIVTDPPYGFNAAADIGELAELYDTAIQRLLSSTHNDAQILIALPDRSYSGKTSPVFTHKEVVIQQFLTNAQDKKYKREILSNVQSIPLPEVYQPPYYWESARALRRSILHLRVKRRT